MHHGHGQRQALADAQRQAGGRCIEKLAQAETGNQFIGARADALGRQVKQPCMQIEILAHAQFAIERKRLRHVADLLARFQIASIHRLAEQRGIAGTGRQKAGEHLHGRGLAATVGAEKTENLAAFDAKTHLIHGSEIAKSHGQTMRLDRRHVTIAQA